MKIVVLAGGTSTEREISIVSGTEVCKALRTKGHRAVLVDVFLGTDQVDWEDPFPEEYDVNQANAYIHRFDAEVSDMAASRKSFWGPNVLSLCDQADMVFLALHGANGEDGRVQATLDLMGIPYTGTGYLSSGIAMDKSLTKAFFRLHGVPTPKGIALDRQRMRTDDWEKDALSRVRAAGLEFPVVVKTCCGGSSVGVYIVQDEGAYLRALEEAFTYEDHVVLEEYISGQEYTVAVVDHEAYPIVEITPIQGFYDYQNKYQAGSTIETCPAPLSPEDTRRMQDLAVKGARALRLEAYCRLDFIMKKNGEMYCLEANTLPGMTPTSLIPKEAAALGMDFPALCEELIRVSLKRRRA